MNIALSLFILLIKRGVIVRLIIRSSFEGKKDKMSEYSNIEMEEVNSNMDENIDESVPEPNSLLYGIDEVPPWPTLVLLVAQVRQASITGRKKEIITVNTKKEKACFSSGSSELTLTANIYFEMALELLTSRCCSILVYTHCTG